MNGRRNIFTRGQLDHLPSVDEQTDTQTDTRSNGPHCERHLSAGGRRATVRVTLAHTSPARSFPVRRRSSSAGRRVGRAVLASSAPRRTD